MCAKRKQLLLGQTTTEKELCEYAVIVRSPLPVLLAHASSFVFAIPQSSFDHTICVASLLFFVLGFEAGDCFDCKHFSRFSACSNLRFK